jgi:hypothetical protein
MDRDPPAASLLGCFGGKFERRSDLTPSIGDHRPGQSRDLASPKTSLHAQQHHHPIPVRVSSLACSRKHTTNFCSAKDLGGLPTHGMFLLGAIELKWRSPG